MALNKASGAENGGSLPSSVRVLVVERQELARIGLQTVYTSAKWINRCFATGDPSIARGIAHKHSPQLAVVSMSLGEMLAVRTVRELQERVPTIKTMLITATDAPTLARFSVNAVVDASTPISDLLRTSSTLLAGDHVKTSSAPTIPRPYGITPREHQVLEQLSVGLSNQEIARMLHLSLNTVKQHTSALYRKLGVRNRAQAVGMASASGLVA